MNLNQKKALIALALGNDNSLNEEDLLQLSTQGYIKYVDDVPHITKLGFEFLRFDPVQFLTKLEKLIPSTPGFNHIAGNLTNTAVIAALYALKSEIEKRNDPILNQKWEDFKKQ